MTCFNNVILYPCERLGERMGVLYNTTDRLEVRITSIRPVFNVGAVGGAGLYTEKTFCQNPTVSGGIG